MFQNICCICSSTCFRFPPSSSLHLRDFFSSYVTLSVNFLWQFRISNILVYLTFPFTFSFSLTLSSSMLNARIVWMIYWCRAWKSRPDRQWRWSTDRQWNSCQQRNAPPTTVLSSNPRPIVPLCFFLLRNRCFQRCETMNESLKLKLQWRWRQRRQGRNKNLIKKSKALFSSTTTLLGNLSQRSDSTTRRQWAAARCLWRYYISSSSQQQSSRQTTTMKMLKWLFDEWFSEREVVISFA